MNGCLIWNRKGIRQDIKMKVDKEEQEAGTETDGRGTGRVLDNGKTDRQR